MASRSVSTAGSSTAADHPDFAVGEEAVFALELIVEGALTRVDRREHVSLDDLGGGRYRIVAEVVHASARATVLRAGVDAYAWRQLHHDHGRLTEGERVSGTVGFGVDPFRYRDLLADTLASSRADPHVVGDRHPVPPRGWGRVRAAHDRPRNRPELPAAGRAGVRSGADAPEDRRRRGLTYGLAAYGVWGIVPLFWPLLQRAGALEILAHRIVWSLVICLVLVRTVARPGWWSRIGNRRSLTMLGAAAAVVSVNWGTYIWAVNHGHVVETALGYYINPILSILVGVIFLRERMHAVQWVCVGLAALAVVVLTVDFGRPPWIALTLATSFATYGVLKKQLNAGAVDTLTAESLLLTPIALGYLASSDSVAG